MHRLLLFGGALLQGSDGPVGGRAAQRHRLALLALLAIGHPRPLSRDKLIGLLWPESDNEGGRRLLRQSLHLLRGTLGDDTLLAHGDELRLDPARLSCDVWEFEEALERGDRAAAVALHAGPFLDGFHLSRSAEFERWLEAERARLAQRCAEALEALAEERAAAGDMQGATGAWRRLTEHDPYHSRYALRLMQALDATGDRAGALRHAALHTALLQDELDVEPDPEITALTHWLREPPARQPAREVRSAVASETPDAERRSRSAPTHPALTGPAGPDPAAIAAEPARSPGLWTDGRSANSRQAWPLVLAGVLLVGLLGTLLPDQRGQRVLALLGIGADRTLLSRGVLVEREHILLADFTSPTGDSALASVATVAFRIDLAQSSILRLVEPEKVRAALERMERSDVELVDAGLARELAVREGIKAVVAGEITRTGGGYLLSAQLLAAESGEILAAHRETARDSTALLPALDRLSKQLRRRIGESLRTLEANPPLERVTTVSLEALRRYTQAADLIDREGDYGQVFALLQEAVALDTAFAMAYLGLSVAAPTAAIEAEMLRRAYRHRDRLPYRERNHLLALYHGWHTWEPDRAITALQSLLKTHPDDALALHNLGALYPMIGDYARAEEYTLRSLAVDSTPILTWVLLGGRQFNQGKIEEAVATFGQVAERFPDYHWLGLRLVWLAAAQGDYAGAEQRAREGRSMRREDSLWQAAMLRLLAELALVRGRLREAERYTQEVSELREQRGEPHLLEVLNLLHPQITLGWPPAQVLERVERELGRRPLVALDDYDRPYPDLAALYARAGQPARARELLADWEAATPLDLRRRAISPARPNAGKALPWVLGEIALAEGKPQEALRQYRLAMQGGCMICTLPHLGRVYETLAQPDSAIAVYERYLRTPFLRRINSDAEWRALVLERLGQLHEARGNRARAAEYYAQIVELWHHADPELQPRVREARRRLAALEGGE